MPAGANLIIWTLFTFLKCNLCIINVLSKSFYSFWSLADRDVLRRGGEDLENDEADEQKVFQVVHLEGINDVNIGTI